MNEKKELYYLGTGTTFIKTQCKEYKTLEGALKAASKDESLVVWDEDGNVIGSLTDNVPEGATETNPDESVNAYNAEGEKVGTVDAETTGNTPQDNAEDGKNGLNDVETTNAPTKEENNENGANTASEGEKETEEDSEGNTSTGITEEETGRFKVVVTCAGSLRLRRSASWDNKNECGRASKGQDYIGKRVFVLNGRPMLETVDGLYMSAAAEHVKIERIG